VWYRDDRVQFALVIVAVVLWLILSVTTGGQSVQYFGPSGAPREATGSGLFYPLLLIATGAAFAPARWRDVAPLAVLATAVTFAILVVSALVMGRLTGFAEIGLSGIGRVVFGLWLLHLICLSLGLGLFRVLQGLVA
jgi:hypothetical protein